MLSVALIIPLSSLRFDYNIESFFAANDDEVEFYHEFLDQYENENNYLLLGIKNNESVFRINFLRKVDSLTKMIETSEAIEKVYAPTNYSSYAKMPVIGFARIPLLHLDDSLRLMEDKELILKSNGFVTGFFSEDNSALKVMLKLNDSIVDDKGREIITELEAIIAAFNFPDWHLAGRLKTQDYYITEMRSEMQWFAAMTFLILIGALFVVLRNVRYVLFATLAILIAMLFVFGIIAQLGFSINLMLTLLPAIILILGTSGSVHLLTKYKQNKYFEKDKVEALKVTLEEVAVPLFYNAVTTAIGFVSLIFIPVGPIQEFGIFAGIGVIISFISTVLLIPSLIKILDSKSLGEIKKDRKIEDAPVRWRKGPLVIRLASVILIVIGLGSVSLLKTNNFFLDDLNEDSSLKTELDFFEYHFGGIRPVELMVTPSQTEYIFSLPVLHDIDQLANFIQETYQVKSVFHPAMLVKSVNRALHGGNRQYYQLPPSQSELDKLRKLIEKRSLGSKFVPLIDKANRSGRISFRSYDYGSEYYSKNQMLLTKYTNENLSHIDVRHTGVAYLIDRANQGITMNLLLGILLAVMVSSVCVALLTNSLYLGVLSVIPNIIPLLFAVGVMLVFNIPLKIGTAMAFTIIYGLAVDDSMHFLFNYKKALRQTGDELSAVRNTYNKVKRPMLYTTVVLSLGFVLLAGSQFTSISTLGVLISTSLLVALLSDFVILPAFLRR